MKGKFLSIFFLLNILEFINSAIEIQDKIVLKDYNMGNMNYSMEKDLGQCACDLSKFCDYKCDCATYDDGKKCDESYEYEDRMDEYLCKSRKRAFEYNKDKAGINLKDHIHSLMCVQFDKTVDLGEFYKKDPEEPDTLAREWVSQFFPTNDIDNVISKSEMDIYKPDSNGYCMKTVMNKFNKNEYSCFFNENDETKIGLKNIGTTENDGTGDNINGVRIYANTQKANILKGQAKLNIVDFKIFWEENGDNTLPKGYSQGNPISIYLANTIYKQYYFPIITNDVNCIYGNEDDAINFKTILFKNNAIYVCKTIDNNIINSNIYNELRQMSICASPKCEKSFAINFDEAKNIDDVNIQLNIYTSKKGTELNQYEEIIGIELFKNTSPIDGVLIFKINFIDVSYASKMNTKNEKITSLIPLPDRILKALEEVDK